MAHVVPVRAAEVVGPDARGDAVYSAAQQRGALKVMLPWLQQHVTEAVAALGDGYWDYA